MKNTFNGLIIGLDMAEERIRTAKYVNRNITNLNAKRKKN